MAQTALPMTRAGLGRTARRDAWWVQPLATFVGLSAFLVYATWAAFQGTHYEFGPYLSPFYSPLLFGARPHSWFGPKPGWWPGALPFSPALLILWAPGGFRVTCYYYRGAYYKAFWADPPSCTVGEPRKASYRGEQSFPLILQNVHRYFLYLAVVFIVILSIDVWKALWFVDPHGRKAFRRRRRHARARSRTSFCSAATRSAATRCVTWSAARATSCRIVRSERGADCVSCLNRRHMRWAWASLFSVAFADLYVRLCSMGIWTDWRDSLRIRDIRRTITTFVIGAAARGCARRSRRRRRAFASASSASRCSARRTR